MRQDIARLRRRGTGIDLQDIDPPIVRSFHRYGILPMVMVYRTDYHPFLGFSIEPSRHFVGSHRSVHLILIITCPPVIVEGYFKHAVVLTLGEEHIHLADRHRSQVIGTYGLVPLYGQVCNQKVVSFIYTKPLHHLHVVPVLRTGKSKCITGPCPELVIHLLLGLPYVGKRCRRHGARLPRHIVVDRL